MWTGIDHKSLLPRWTKTQLPLSMNCWSFFMLSSHTNILASGVAVQQCHIFLQR
uniref:Uncharacterized protein n=1 Tax=Oryza barthii TaxID=65489 RepID=A0A0D3HC67_9ORYZ